MSGPATPKQFHFFLLFQLVLYSTLDCCAPSFHKMHPWFWWTPAGGHGLRPSSVTRQILVEGNCAAQLFWNTIGLRRKTAALKKVCATAWSTIVWPSWSSPPSPYTMSRCIESSGLFGFLRHRFRIENWQSALCWIQYKRVRPIFPHGFMLRLRPFLFLFSVKRRSHPTS